MPTQRLKSTKAEDQENRIRLSRLEKMGIPIGPADDPSYEPDRLTIEQTEDELARIYELPLGEVGVVVPALMIILKSGVLITHFAMMTPWDDPQLDLWDPEENSSYYKQLTSSSYHFPLSLLNPYLKREFPLNVCKVEGVIIAHGYGSIPSKYHDESLVTVKLLLKDERRDELCFNFEVRVDRSMKRKYERQHQERIADLRLTKGGGLYAPKRGQLGDQKSVSRKEAIKQPYASGHDTTRTQGL